MEVKFILIQKHLLGAFHFRKIAAFARIYIDSLMQPKILLTAKALKGECE